MKTNYLPMGQSTVNSVNKTCQIYNMEVFSSKIHGLQKHDSVTNVVQLVQRCTSHHSGYHILQG